MQTTTTTATQTATTPAKKLRVPKATVASVTADAKKAASTTKADGKAKAVPKEKTPSKFISVDIIRDGQRMRVAEYQDYTFSINDRKDRRLTDTELCADWQKQFPNAVTYVPGHVTGARRDYNMGKHSKAFPNRKDPQSQAWFLVGDTRTQTPPAKAPAADAPAKAKTAKAKTVTPDAKGTAVPKGKAARKQTAA